MPTPTELQELQLRVALNDEASLGLGKLREELKQLSEGQAKRSLDKFRGEQEEFGKQIKELSELAGSGGKALSGYIGKFGVAGAAFGGLAATLVVGLQSLKEFSDRLVDLTNKSKVIGIHPAEMQSIIEQYQRLGISASTVEQSLSGFSQVMADVNRAGSQKRMQMIESAGAWGQLMNDGIARVQAQTTWANKLNEVLLQAQNVYDNRLKETHGNIADATKSENDFLKLWNLDPSVKILRNLENVTEERKKVIEQRAKLAADYKRTITELGQEWEGLWADMKTSALGADGVIVEGLHLALDLVKELHAWWHGQGTTMEDLVKKMGQAPPANFEDRFGKASDFSPSQPIAPPSNAANLMGGGGPPTKDLGDGFSKPGFSKGWEWMRKSNDIEDRREFDDTMVQGDDYVKALTDNTVQVKKMNENFKLLDQGQVGLLGLGGLPGFGSGGGAGAGAGGSGFGGGGASGGWDGGVSAPSGTSVGPGTGKGAKGKDEGGAEDAAPTDSKGNQINADVYKQAELIAGDPSKSREQRENDAKRFITSHGGHVDSAWCGDFVGAVERSRGATLPKGYQVATSWAGWGTPVKPGQEQPGDIAVMTRGRGIGQTGGHVMIVGSGGAKDGRVQTFGANTAREGWMSEGGLTFRRPPPIDNADRDRSTIDANSGDKSVRTVKVETGGKLTAEVNAPKGTDVKVEGGGAFKNTETNRTMPINAN